MKTVGVFAYGETGYAALKALLGVFRVAWVIVPPEGAYITTSSEAVEKLAMDNRILIVKTNSVVEIKKLFNKNIPDAVVISSYNKILPGDILSLSKFINIHHGDLPRFRGRANINWAIILGRTEIGLTFHEATIDLDAGRIYKQHIVPIKIDDTVKTIYDAFNKIIEKELAGIVEMVIGGYEGEHQKGELTYCCTRIPEDGYIDWNQTSQQIHNKIRALTKPYPGAFTYFDGKKMVIWSSEIPLHPKKYEGRIPGRIISINDNGVELLTGDSSIIIKEVKYNGKDCHASAVVTTVKKSLGISIVDLYEGIQKMLKNK